MGAVVISPAGIAALGASQQMVETMDIFAEQIETLARDVAPVLTGEFQASIQHESGVSDGQAYGRALSDDDKAVYIEFGTNDTPTFQPFRLACDRFRA